MLPAGSIGLLLQLENLAHQRDNHEPVLCAPAGCAFRSCGRASVLERQQVIPAK